MGSVALKRESNFLPILLVIKVYTGFLMTNSYYSIGIFGKLQIFFIWMVFFFSYFRKIKPLPSVVLSFSLVTIYFLGVYLMDMDYSNKAILYDISLVYIFLSLSRECQIQTFRYFIGFGTILLLLSIIDYLFFITGHGIILGEFDRGESETSELPVYQGLFNYYIITERSYFRFQSLFREPGYLGQCAGLVFLYWGKIPLKQSIIWLIAGLMTVSMFFYVFLIISIPILLFINRGKSKTSNFKLRYIIIIFCLLTAAVMAAPDELLEFMGHRVEVFAEEGSDNRSTATFNMELTQMVNSGEIIWGRGTSSFYQKGYAWGNTGIKGDLYKFGIWGVSIVIIAFALMVRSFKASITTKLLIVLFFVLLFYNGDIKYALFIYIPLINLLHYIDGDLAFINQTNLKSIIKKT